MPLTAKGNKILAAMKKNYGEKKGEEVFYASKNAGKITGVDEDDITEDEAAKEACRIWEQFGNKTYCLDQKKTKAEADYEPEAKTNDCCDRCEHFTAPDQCGVVDGSVSPGGWCKYFAQKMAHDAWAFDAPSMRQPDHDGRLHVELTPISKANVCPYTGREIQDANPDKPLGLDADKIYYMLRHPDELKKAADSSNGIQLLKKHIGVNADSHKPYDTVGATGTDATFDGTYLKNSLVVWAKDAIDDILSEEKKELSCAYYYTADMTPGVYQGQAYDGVMRDIKFNHVALVPKGRAGPDVCVADSAPSLFYDRFERAFDEWKEDQDSIDGAKEQAEKRASGVLNKKDEPVTNKGTIARSDENDIYLDQSAKKYRVKVQRDGKWSYDCTLLTSAAHAARMVGKDEIAKRADAIREREFGKDGQSLERPVFTKDSLVAANDSKESLEMSVALSKTAMLAKGALHAYLRPRLAADAAIELDPFLIGLKGANFADKKAGLTEAIAAEFKGKLAKDASLNGLGNMLDLVVGDAAEEYKDEEEEEEKKKKEASDKRGGAKDEDDDDDEEKKRKESKAEDDWDDEDDDDEEKKKKKAEDKRKGAKDDCKEEMVSKKAMDEALAKSKKTMDDAIAKAVKVAQDEAIRIQNDINEARNAVAPWVGTLAVSFDSAEKVYRQALKNLGCGAADSINEIAALKALLELHPKPGAAAPARGKEALAQDSAAAGGFFDRFPDARRIRIG